MPNLKKALSYLRQYKDLTGAFFTWKSFFAGVVRAALGGATTDEIRGYALMQIFKRQNNPVAKAYKGPFNLFKPQTLKALPDHCSDPLNLILFADFHRRVLPRILKNFDLMSMAHGVEVRMPFMDYRLVTYVFSLNSQSKIGSGFTKLLLREAMQGILPEPVRTRKLKLGFNSPLQKLLPGVLKPWVEETLHQQSPLDHLLDRELLQKYYKNYIVSNKTSWNEVALFWKFVSALRWAKLVDRSIQ